MNNIYNNMIEYSGISSYIPKDIDASKELTVNSTIDISSRNKEFQEIIKVSVFAKIINHRIISTPAGKSLEGQVITGKKFILDGDLNIRIDYIPKSDSNKIFCMHHIDYFSCSLFLNEGLKNRINLIPSIFIESINAQLINDTELFIISSLLATVER